MLFLLSLPFLLGTCLPSLWSPPFPLFAPALIPLSLAKVRLTLTLTLSPLTIWYSGLTALFLFLLAKAALSFSAGPVCSSFSPEACAVLQTLCWSRQHQQVCHFSFLLLLSDSRSVLTTLSTSPSSFLPQISRRSGRNCFLSLHLLNQVTMALWTLVSPGERRGQ